MPRVGKTGRTLWRGTVGATALATVFGFALLAAPGAQAASAVTVSSEAELLQAFVDANTGETVTATLSTSLTLTSAALELTAGELTLDLDGHTLDVEAPEGLTALTIDEGATLHVTGGGTLSVAGGAGAPGQSGDDRLPAPSGQAENGPNGSQFGDRQGGDGENAIFDGQAGGAGGNGHTLYRIIDAVGGNGGNGGNGAFGGNGGNGGNGGGLFNDHLDALAGDGGSGGDGGIGAHGGRGGDGGSASTANLAEGGNGGNGGAGGVGASGETGEEGHPGINNSGVLAVGGGVEVSTTGGAGGMGGAGGSGGDGGAGGNGGTASANSAQGGNGGNGGAGGAGGKGGSGGAGGPGLETSGTLILTRGASLSQNGGTGGVGGATGPGGLGGTGGFAGMGTGDHVYSGTLGSAGSDGADGLAGDAGTVGSDRRVHSSSIFGVDDASQVPTIPLLPRAILHANNGTSDTWWFAAPTLGDIETALSAIGEPTLSGHTLLGWRFDPSSGSVLPANTATNGSMGNVVLWAQWELTSTGSRTPGPSAPADPSELAATGASPSWVWVVAAATVTLAGGVLALSRRHRVTHDTER